ncbi:hypothetical protein BZA05DRAFT_380821 [Tricharina praecox]|uniref:uncharacterized protein n=1 Tax=Tricharina praecox TaxID=43433 RepID=UPI002220BCFE|nr:uncharacterized protein BZA05DRAFT_380821 [Tricharina praecox]KAI5858315.1 hypothetical protein BZA05DRAFT_380821 [Tricharina praecox]
MSIHKALSIFSRDPPPYEPTKVTYTLPPSTHDTLITCTTSSSQPSYHIPSPLTTRLQELIISGAVPSTSSTSSSSLPRYRDVYKIMRLPFVGFQLTSGSTRAQYHLVASAFQSRPKERGLVFLHTPLGNLRTGEDRPALKVKHDAIEDAVTGEVLARGFMYKTGEAEVRALELAEGYGDDARMRELLIAVWICGVWNSSLEMKMLARPAMLF